MDEPQWCVSSPAIGLAYGPAVRRILASDPSLADFVEIPFELLESNEAVIDAVGDVPVILHCATLSIAGATPPRDQDLTRVSHWLERTGSPWLGEHLAYIRVEDPDDEGRGGGAIEAGFTMPPPMNAQSVASVCAHVSIVERNVGVPLLLENSPLYFDVPGSTLSQVDYIRAIMNGCGADLLLDLTHLHITARNAGFSAAQAIAALPLERVREIHLSGVEEAGGIFWDNHASEVPNEVLQLLSLVLGKARPWAITLEYNWTSDFADEKLIAQVATVREIVRGFQ